MFEKIKYYYEKGLYKKTHLDIFLLVKSISEAEYNEILKGEKYG